MHDNHTLDLARKLADSVADSAGQTAGALVALAAAGSLHPMAALAATACGAALLANHLRRATRDPMERTAKQRKALREGFTIRLGDEATTRRPVILDCDELRQHMLVLGTTGSAKTHFLLGLSEQAVAAGTGLLYVDGKGDVSLFAKAFAMASRHGRLDDLLVLNLMTGNADTAAYGRRLHSNTLNPLASGTADNLTQLVISLMDDTGHDAARRKGQATVLFAGLMRALVWLRDHDGLGLDIPILRDHLALGAIVGLATGASAPGLPEEVRAGLSSYLSSLPGYNPERGERQAQTVLDHHAEVEVGAGRILGSLADAYAHVFRTRLSDIDMQDVVLNRRILVVMLPALEKSGDELADLGRVVLATLKAMMGAALGNRIVGSWEEIVDNRVTNSESPFLCVLDEVGYYAVDGLALMAAQARSLGFAMVYGSPDIPAMKRLNEREAASIIANTNTKMFLRTEEMEAASGFEYDYAGSARRARMDRELRLWRQPDWADLKDLGVGDGIVLFKGAAIRVRIVMFEPDRAVTSKLVLRANHLIPLAPPSTVVGAAA